MKCICALIALLYACSVDCASMHSYYAPHIKAQRLYELPLYLGSCSLEQRNDILAIAAQLGNLSRVKDAVVAGADPTGASRTISPLMHAVYGGNHHVVRYLLMKKAHVNRLEEYGLSPFHLAIRIGGLPVIRTCIEFGADISSKTEWCLDAYDIAIMYHYDDSTKWLAIVDVLDEAKKK